MPFEIMDQRAVSASSHFFDGSFYSENAGLQRPKSAHDHYHQGKNGMAVSPGSILNALSPREISAKTGWSKSSTGLSGETIEKLHIGEEGNVDMFKASKEALSHHPRSQSNVRMQPASNPYGLIGNKIITNAASRESSLFSSSLSEIFTRKLRLTGNDVVPQQPVTVGSLPDDEPYKSLEEIEADTIGNLLPDEDDLFSGVIDDLGLNILTKTGDDLEDFDLFSSGGGMELEGDEHLTSGKRTSGPDGDLGCFGGFKAKLPFGEHPSRTLFVRNINSNVEDSELETLFEQYGDVRTTYTACKHRGFVMISYYDIRAAQNAMKALQNRSLRSRKLDIHYSIPKVNAPEKDTSHGTLLLSGLDSSISHDELLQIFGFYGEIKEICESPEMNHDKFIEFYDVRAAEAALHALNKSEIAGRQIKLEPRHPRGLSATCLMQQSQKEQNESDLSQSISDNLSLRQNAITSSGVVASGCLDNVSDHGFPATIRQTMDPLPINVFAHVNSGIHNTVRGSSIPRFHPHSLPEYHDGLTCGSPYNLSRTFSNVSGNMGPGVTDGSDSRHTLGFGSTGKLSDFNGGGNVSLPNHGLYHMWSGSNVHQQTPPGPMVWQKTPSFVNGVCAPCLQQMPGFPRSSSHMLRASHLDHHVGSAPVVTASPWDRQHSYLAESPESSGFHMGSLGSPGFPGTWQLRPPEFSSHKMFPHVGGNGMDLSPNAGQSSPNQLSHVFPGRHPMTSMSKFDPANDRMRNLYHRRSDANTNSADKKQFELDLSRILNGEDTRTTLMIKNIPNKYTSKMLLAAIDEQCRGTYDFLYLPIDFKNKCNVGYAFINMTDPSQIIPFHKAFNGKKWEKFNSEKVASLAYARIQGKAALITHFQNSSLMNEDKRCRPILFHTEGPNAGDPEPFPMGTNIRLRPGKSRARSPSALTSGEESSNGISSSMGSSKNSD
ncbi:protein MEI2-like 1 isoform X2 [Neltuma alba]|uniref:protein MEI2-like 1 isoform X2 n=1 Tax=Neltuma alba TaxID=207710 RepID=UPI0010A54D6E|nr:protein MEI2-like 1 isoform X2 [Prosopis alba]